MNYQTMNEPLEKQLDSFDPDLRRQALAALCRQVRDGAVRLPPPSLEVNLHAINYANLYYAGVQVTVGIGSV